MTITDLMTAAFTDMFRWAMLVALVLTASNTRAVTGTLVPLAAGIVFVAVLLPMTMTRGAAPMLQQVATGLVVNAVIVAVILMVRRAWLAFRAPRG